jgi:hypothetical protein
MSWTKGGLWRRSCAADSTAVIIIANRWKAFIFYPDQKKPGHEVCWCMENNMRQ